MQTSRGGRLLSSTRVLVVTLTWQEVHSSFSARWARCEKSAADAVTATVSASACKRFAKSCCRRRRLPADCHPASRTPLPDVPKHLYYPGRPSTLLENP